ncbi:hypothetical protein BBP40_005603 [Aspergillus hancockii]|nr:hypothetical protein BBP40_005603 [Aspergillus hancockii]
MIAESTHVSAAFSRFYEYFDTSYAIFEILGSTLVKSKQQYKPLFTTIPPLDILKRSESQTWTGCPAELLYIVSLVNSATSNPGAPSPGLISYLFSQVEAFSPHRWALSSSNLSHLASRYHVSCIYKAAVLIYMSQVFSSLPYQNYPLEPVCFGPLDSIIMHFTPIQPQNIYFKGLLWPAFIIGAEARSATQRAQITKVFEDLWTLWRAYNVRHALEVLNKIWARETTTTGTSQPWIEYLYEQGENWMFV